MDQLDQRGKFTNSRLTALKSRLAKAGEIAEGRACVYATGSYGRGEACQHSDLDIFLVGPDDLTRGGEWKQRLSRLDEICLKAEIIHATKEMGFPDFSGDGKYLALHSSQDLTINLGGREDDSSNTFTARLLLLLESRPLVEDSVYTEVIDAVIAAYWRDYADHMDRFVPAFLINDILRLWRTFCVNYEANTQREPDEKKAKGRLQNFKLKHSRMLTCYSAILFLLHKFARSGTVSVDDAKAMVSFTPTQRIQFLLDEDTCAETHPVLLSLLQKYDNFLQITDAPEEVQIAAFLDRQQSRERLEQAAKFGDDVAEAVNRIGKSGRLLRLLTV